MKKKEFDLLEVASGKRGGGQRIRENVGGNRETEA